MNFDTFAELLRKSLPEGLVLDNPGGGTSTVMWCDKERVCYRRGNARLYVGIRSLHEAYLRFSGRDVTTKQLREYDPPLYDPGHNGHSCHCTFFFVALWRMGVVEEIWKRGHPRPLFGVSLPPLPTCGSQEEIPQEFALLAGIRCGQAAAAAQRIVDHEEVRRRSAAWSTPSSGPSQP